MLIFFAGRIPNYCCPTRGRGGGKGKGRGRYVVCTCSQFSYKLRPITFFSWQGKKNAHKAKEESSKRSQRKREWERESEREEEKNGQKLLMMASSSSDPGSWLIKPSYGMDGGWIGQRGCCCGPVGMCQGEGGWGGVGNLGRNFSFVFAFVLLPLARKLRRTPRERERGGGVMVSGADGRRANYSPNTPR